MSIQTIKNRLHREAKAHPAKAAVLGGLFLVGVYSWAPLVASWTSGGNAAAPKKTADPNANLIPNVALMATATVPNKATNLSSTKVAWRTVSEWLDHDPRTSATAAAPAPQRDPFQATASARQAEQQREQQAVAATARLRMNPLQLGMMLEGTLIGSRQKTAVIDGKIYREGQRIQVGKTPRSAEFELRTIERRRVVLAAGSELYELRIPSLAATETRDIPKNKP